MAVALCAESLVQADLARAALQVDVLVDEKKASSQQKQRVCTVVAHELAHQWYVSA